MSRIKDLYTYLVANRLPQLDGWREEYENATTDVAAIRAGLASGKDLTSKELYAGTAFENKSDPWFSFARFHLYERSNGVSSRGQSVLSETNFKQFVADSAFRAAFVNLIARPDKPTFTAFDAAWGQMCQKLGAGKNPLLVNRILAACTFDVTSTANVSAFMSVYSWLSQEGLLPSPTPDPDWYDKNVQVMKWLKQEFAEELKLGKTTEVLLSVFVWEMFVNITNPFSIKKQVIRYGAPGTGKTFTAKRDTSLLFEIWRKKYNFTKFSPTHADCSEIVQFHPSYGYEDFMEGLRPVLGEDDKPKLTLQNGHFKEFCRRAGRWEVEVHAIPDAGPALAAKWDTLTLRELRPYFIDHLRDEFWREIQQRADGERIADIVPPFFFIIDEINRAELSRVLGELMLCLEYRGAGNSISTQYAALNNGATGMLKIPSGYRFFIPHNVYVIGTMNTIDRSVESFDLALRRRFRWEQVTPDIAALRYHLKGKDKESGRASRDWSKLADDLEQLNERIRREELLGADYEIGHAYLMNPRYAPTLTRTEVRENVWDDAIRPLLEEYLRGSGRSATLIPEFAKAFGL